MIGGGHNLGETKFHVAQPHRKTVARIQQLQNWGISKWLEFTHCRCRCCCCCFCSLSTLYNRLNFIIKSIIENFLFFDYVYFDYHLKCWAYSVKRFQVAQQHSLPSVFSTLCSAAAAAVFTKRKWKRKPFEMNKTPAILWFRSKNTSEPTITKCTSEKCLPFIAVHTDAHCTCCCKEC